LIDPDENSEVGSEELIQVWITSMNMMNIILGFREINLHYPYKLKIDSIINLKYFL
jgi:hypothetical protein